MTSEIPYADLQRMLAQPLNSPRMTWCNLPSLLILLSNADVLDLFILPVGIVSETMLKAQVSPYCTASAPNLSLSLSGYLGEMT